MSDAETSAGEGKDRRLIFIDAAPFFGGAQHSLFSLLEILSRCITDSAILYSADGTANGLGQRIARYPKIEVRSFRCRHWNRSFYGIWQMIADIRSFSSLVSASDCINSYEDCVVYANGWRSALLWRFSSLRKYPCIFQDRDMHVPGLIVRCLAKKVAGIIGASNAVLEKWREYLPERCLHKIPLGFALPKVVSKEKSDGRRTKIALVGDFVGWKNHLLLLKALEILQAQNAEISAHIVGRCISREAGNIVSELRQFIRDHGLKNIRIDLDGGDGVKAIAEADMLVSCARGESFGRTVVEALALGRPVAAVAEGAIPEVLEGCTAATLCKASPENLAEAIAQWLSPEKREAVAAQARNFAARYSLQAMAEQTLQVLRHV